MKRLCKELKYSLWLTVHPMKGFWEIKHEGEGSLRTAAVILAMAIITSILSNFHTGALFNKSGGLDYNFLKTIGVGLALYFLWCIANWCLTSLMDGEGKFKDILIATAYALVPYIIIQLPLIALSNIFVLREAAFYQLFYNCSLMWTGALIFFGTLVTHQYFLLKNIVVCAATILGMAIMAYIGLLFFTLIQQMMGFVTIITNEISLRLWS